jgi:23S rRNA (guanosine2251-2'-O)-methyltransferase
LRIKKTGRIGRLKPDSEWLYGLNPVMEALRAGRDITCIFLSYRRQDKVAELKEEAEKRNIPVNFKDPIFFDSRFKKGHQGIAAEVSHKEYAPLNELLAVPFQKNETPLFLILDCVEDPRNLGAILRVADAAGVHGIVIQSHRSVTLSSEVSKVSAGAIEYVPVAMESNIKYAINNMKELGITIIGAEAAETDKQLWEIDFVQPVALVIGSEGKGIRKTVREKCDVLVNIPMRGRINSLNVSVATGIFLFEILRQRLSKNEKNRENSRK